MCNARAFRFRPVIYGLIQTMRHRFALVVLCVATAMVALLLQFQPKPSNQKQNVHGEWLDAFETKEFALRSYMQTDHVGDAWTEFTERDLAFKYTRKNACVLEFGGGSGSVSYVIQRILTNPSDHVVIQPDDAGAMFGGVRALRQNKSKQGCQYHIIDHVLEANEADVVSKLVSKPFDTLVADCEGCLVAEYHKNPELFVHLTQVQVERDDRLGGGFYQHLLTNILQMKMVYQGSHLHPQLTVEVWEKKTQVPTGLPPKP
jgi:hypothetical protein